VDATRGPSRDNESIDRRLAQLATLQHGVFSRAQAFELGCTPKQARYRLDVGRWIERHRGVYAIAGSTQDVRHDAMAAALWAGDGSVVSHASAGMLWGFEGVRARNVELWTSRSVKSNLVVVHRGTRIDRSDRATVGPIPVTTPIRTLIDLSPRFEDLRLSALLESTIKAGVVKPDRLRARLHSLRSSGRAGAGRLARLLDARGTGRAMESTLEALVWSIIDASGLPRPERQFWVVVAGGRYRLDFAWPDVRVALECDGYGSHGSTREVFGKDRARYAELVAAGYRVLPVTWHVAHRDPHRVTRWLGRTLALAA
jgi:very-short-patch-repair endonuclease